VFVEIAEAPQRASTGFWERCQEHPEYEVDFPEITITPAFDEIRDGTDPERHFSVIVEHFPVRFHLNTRMEGQKLLCH
jgi:hypothetical protein